MKTATERVLAMRQRRYEAGLSQLVLWVPKERATEIRSLVKRLLDDSTLASADWAVGPSSARVWIVFSTKAQPPGLKKKLREAGFKCAKAGVWTGSATQAVVQKLEPLVIVAGGEFRSTPP